MVELAAPQLKSWLSEQTAPVRLLDVREPWEYALCRIEGSTHIPLGELPRRVGELDPGAPLVLVCHHGVRSRHAGLFLERLGFSRLVNLAGGIDGWARAVEPGMPVY